MITETLEELIDIVRQYGATSIRIRCDQCGTHASIMYVGKDGLTRYAVYDRRYDD